jgi:rare lipoprotein A
MHSISAAHTTMPLPSYARVTNLDNGRSIVVRVNDRGPYARNRVIDVSIGAAKQLDFHGRGLANVRVEYIGRAPIDGSDDRMLMATLRHGSPAPAPSRVMIASSTPLLPFIPRTIDGRGRQPEGRSAAAPERPFTLGRRRREHPRASQPEAARPAGRQRSVVRLPDPPAAARLRARATDGTLGLMSGRGL